MVMVIGRPLNAGCGGSGHNAGCGGGHGVQRAWRVLASRRMLAEHAARYRLTVDRRAARRHLWRREHGGGAGVDGRGGAGLACG